MNIPNQAAVGAILIVVGTVLFVPGAIGQTDLLGMVSLFAAAVLLTAGTYLYGTSGDGRPV